MIKTLSLLMMLVALVVAFHFNTSGAWFTYSNQNDTSVVMGHINLDVYESETTIFPTSVNASSVTVLGDSGSQFDQVVTVLDIEFKNSGTVPLRIQGSLQETINGSDKGLLYYLVPIGNTSTTYEADILAAIGEYESFAELKNLLAFENEANFEELFNNAAYALDPDESISIRLILWVDYHQANLQGETFASNEYLLQITFGYIHKVSG
jgi:hypothetical protein